MTKQEVIGAMNITERLALIVVNARLDSIGKKSYTANKLDEKGNITKRFIVTKIRDDYQMKVEVIS